MTFTRPLLMGLRDYLIARGVTATIVAGDLPSTPDQAIALNMYAASDPLEVARADVRVQAMCRGDVNDSLSGADLADQLFDILHGLEDLWIGELHIAICARVSVIPHGADDNKRSLRSDNYQLTVDVPVTTRRPA